WPVTGRLAQEPFQCGQRIICRPARRLPLAVSLRDTGQGVFAVDGVQVVAPRLLGDKAAVDQPVEDGGAVHVAQIRLQEVIHGRGGDGTAENGQRLHGLLRRVVQAAVRFAHQRHDHVFRRRPRQQLR
ncbi:hypothetical protein RZS08_47225, partial [Arthrospira platensis SPKY1]|nr:hypothetical protein [Arthrospira platensis SPKY1]